MDDLATRQVPFEQLDALVPKEVDDYWQITLRFLKIAREAWPAILAEKGKIEPAARRDHLIKAEAERLVRSKGPGGGRRLHRLDSRHGGIARHHRRPAARCVSIARARHRSRPGLLGKDQRRRRTESSSAAGHAQFAMHSLLKRIGILRDAVTALAEPAAHGRERIISEALRPAATTQFWLQKLMAPDFAQPADMALSSISVIEAANAEEEALAAAVALREAVEMPGVTAALATPDRALARRVPLWRAGM